MMGFLNYQDNRLFAENVSIEQIASEFGTPAYLYSRKTLEDRWRSFDEAFEGRPHLVCYAVKANSNLAVLNVLARLGSGFDIVSLGELERVLAAGGDPKKIVFSGVGKKESEIARALEVGIFCFNVEVSSELDRINRVAGHLGVKAPVSFRVNPDVDAKTHPYISTGLKENKFGIAIESALSEYQRAAALPNIHVVGIDCHIGSQLTEMAPFLDAVDRILALVDELEGVGISLDHIDLGGGLGITYQNETPPLPSEYVTILLQKFKHRPQVILMEPGRAIVGNAGALLTRVEYLKPTAAKNFAIVDAAMNDLIRPSLYSAWQEIVPVRESGPQTIERWDIVGPVCETGDFLGKDRELSISEGDYLIIRSSGAYGFSMSSNYNSRPRAVEVMVDDARCYVVRQRESIESLWAGESVLP